MVLLLLFCAGQILEQGLIPGVSDVELSADSRTLIATHPDHLGRPHRVGLQVQIIWASLTEHKDREPNKWARHNE